MYRAVYPIHRRPLVVRTGVDYRFTALVVDQVDAVDGRYEVLFLGTGEQNFLSVGPSGDNHALNLFHWSLKSLSLPPLVRVSVSVTRRNDQ